MADLGYYYSSMAGDHLTTTGHTGVPARFQGRWRNAVKNSLGKATMTGWQPRPHGKIVPTDRRFFNSSQNWHLFDAAFQPAGLHRFSFTHPQQQQQQQHHHHVLSWLYWI
ncbi:hypothetical protein T4E_9631 [Trichinella pseudospiralis]|uniref:Uncharacterized protein n=1 Tax=Trichinella pseudospiralis TaxID=6337 RepID=A0A0V0YFN6_TRIPS|nr:hypothetical protein T4E_9631 [Trichinella pseudospiralis]